MREPNLNTVVLDGAAPLYPQIYQLLEGENKEDISRCMLLIPHDFLKAALEQFFLEQGSLFLPKIVTLQQVAKQLASRDDKKSKLVLNQHQCRILLTELIKNHPRLYGKGSPWGLSNNLLRLFDELSYKNIDSDDLQAVFDSLEQEGLWQNEWQYSEKEIILTLWRAWLLQMQADNWQDESNHFLQNLFDSDFSLLFATNIFYLKPAICSIGEQQWLQRLQQHCLQTKNCHLSVLEIGAVDLGATLERFDNSVKTISCHNQEQQALAIASQAKINYQRQQYTAIVCADRQLARRVQALLTRFGINIDDKSGWALSTTNVGAAVYYWLNCIDNDFYYQDFISCLNNAFIVPNFANKNEISAFFSDNFIYKQKIYYRLDAYLEQLEQQLSSNTEADSKLLQLQQLLKQFKQAAAHLKPLMNRKHGIEQFSLAFEESLSDLQAIAGFAKDDAGKLILQLIDDLKSLPQQHAPNMTWNSFKTAIHQALDGLYYRPKVAADSVSLLTLEQCSWVDAKALIIGAANDGKLPPAQKSLPFFSPNLRNRLKLEDKASFEKRHLLIFKRLLATLTTTQQQVLISWQTKQQQASLNPSKWLLMYQLVAGNSFYADADFNRQIFAQTAAIIAQPKYAPPCGKGAHKLYQGIISVGAHQRLIDSPYEFYVQDLLKLRQLDATSNSLTASDYGSLVHKILNVFFIDAQQEQFRKKDLLEQAAKKLVAVSKQAFQTDLARRFDSKLWFEKWLKIIPQYLIWESKRQLNWQVLELEYKVSKEFKSANSSSLQLWGRVDRIDKNCNTQQLSIIDYKTGYSPKLADILNGEDVQISSYALLLDKVAQVMYLPLQQPEYIKSNKHLADEDLAALSQQLLARLLTLNAAILDAHQLPTWRSAALKNCEFCLHPRISREDFC